MKKLCLMVLMLIMTVNAGCSAEKNIAPINNVKIVADNPSNKVSDNTVNRAEDSSLKKDLDSTISKVAEKTANSGNSIYDINKAEYVNKKVKINYPEITKLGNSGLQSNINKIIKLDALKILNDYKDDLDKLNLEMNYEIKYKGSNVLSIQYLGVANVNGAAHPVNLYNTTNIDLLKGSRLTLKEVAAINSSFIEKYKAGKYKPYSTDLNLESEDALKPVIDDITNSDLNQELQKDEAKFYFSKDSLGISMEVPHAVGDHIEMEINYKDLGNLLLLTPKETTSISEPSASSPTKGNAQEEVIIKASYEKPLSLKNNNTILLKGLAEGEEYVEIIVNGEIYDFEQIELKWDEKTNELKEKETKKKMGKLVNQTLVIKTCLPEGIPTEKIKWKDRNGKTFEYIIRENSIG